MIKYLNILLASLLVMVITFFSMGAGISIHHCNSSDSSYLSLFNSGSCACSLRLEDSHSCCAKSGCSSENDSNSNTEKANCCDTENITIKGLSEFTPVFQTSVKNIFVITLQFIVLYDNIFTQEKQPIIIYHNGREGPPVPAYGKTLLLFLHKLRIPAHLV